MKQSPDVGFNLSELIDLACKDKQVEAYFPSDKDKRKSDSDHKIRNLIDILLQNPSIQAVKYKPYTFKWIQSASASTSLQTKTQEESKSEVKATNTNNISSNNNNRDS
ncbi:MAG TPA: hypothetical protein VFI70_09520 [Nitrososphaeraceae archaeon]|nr:hypothetical protein [Nitrososphaeraceae archaeon]